MRLNLHTNRKYTPFRIFTIKIRVKHYTHTRTHSVCTYYTHCVRLIITVYVLYTPCTCYTHRVSFIHTVYVLYLLCTHYTPLYTLHVWQPRGKRQPNKFLRSCSYRAMTNIMPMPVASPINCNRHWQRVPSLLCDVLSSGICNIMIKCYFR